MSLPPYLVSTPAGLRLEPRGYRHERMAGKGSSIVLLIPQSDYGRVLVDELERGTRLPPFHANGGTGARMYDVGPAGIHRLDAALERLAPNWRQHLTRMH